MLQNDEQILVLALGKNGNRSVPPQHHMRQFFFNKTRKKKTKNSPRQITHQIAHTNQTHNIWIYWLLKASSASCKKSCVSSSRVQDFMATLVSVSPQHQRRRVFERFAVINVQHIAGPSINHSSLGKVTVGFLINTMPHHRLRV